MPEEASQSAMTETAAPQAKQPTSMAQKVEQILARLPDIEEQLSSLSSDMVAIATGMNSPVASPDHAKRLEQMWQALHDIADFLRGRGLHLALDPRHPPETKTE